MQKLFGRVLFWVTLAALAFLIIVATTVSVVLGAVGKILFAVAEAVLEIAEPITDAVNAKLTEIRKPANKLAVIEVTEETFDDYDARWVDDALVALRSGETVRLDGIAEILAKRAAEAKAKADELLRKREAWERMSPVERYMHTHPASEGGPKTVDEALAAMKAEAGRPFDFNDPAVQPVASNDNTGAVRLQSAPAGVRPPRAMDDATQGRVGEVNVIQGQAPEVPRNATHGYEPDVAQVETRIPTSDMSQQEILDEAIAFGEVRSSDGVMGRYRVELTTGSPGFIDAEDYVRLARASHGIKTEATPGTFGRSTEPVAKDGPYDLQAAAKALCDGPVVGFQNPANLPG